jgi:hypothetical protein
MRTTLILPDSIHRRAKAAARRLNRTLSELTAEALELQLLAMERRVRPEGGGFKLKTYEMGEERVDLSDREALYSVMEEQG